MENCKHTESIEALSAGWGLVVFVLWVVCWTGHFRLKGEAARHCASGGCSFDQCRGLNFENVFMPLRDRTCVLFFAWALADRRFKPKVS